MSDTTETPKLTFTSFDNSMTNKEIQNHKKKLHNLTTQLINTNNIEEETSINDEIKNEFEFLSSLLKIKRNTINKFNKEFPDPKKREEMIYQQMKKQQQMMQQEKLQQEKEEEMRQQKLKEINNQSQFLIKFQDRDAFGGKPIVLICSLNEMLSSIIERYNKKIGEDYSHEEKKYIYNSKALNPNLTVAESGIAYNAIILVIRPQLIG